MKTLRQLGVSLTDLVAAIGLGIFTVLSAVLLAQSIIAGTFLK